jgi:hypothetical protein
MAYKQGIKKLNCPYNIADTMITVKPLIQIIF